jgi:hypothetical protein
LRPWKRCEKNLEGTDTESLFFATREERKKFGLEGGLLCLYECVVSGVLLQLRKIPKRASSVFPSQPCRKDFSHPGGKPDRCFVFLSPTVERRGRREREKETRVSVQKGRCLMVFLSALSFCFFSSFGLAMFRGHFRLVFSALFF